MSIRSDNYINIQGWMYTIGLEKLNEIVAFALIHGFSQDGESTYNKGFGYISDFLMCDKRTAMRVLNSLEEKGLIEKEQIEINNVKFNRYKVSEGVVTKFHHQCKNVTGGSDKISPIYINNNKSSNNPIINNSLIPTPPISPIGGLESELSQAEIIFDEFRKIYKGNKRGLKTEFENFKKKHKDWKEVLPNLKALYEQQQAIKENARNRGCFVPVEKNLQTYLNQRCWEEELNFENNERKYISEADRAREGYRELSRDIFDFAANANLE